jgi:hypothetical protein
MYLTLSAVPPAEIEALTDASVYLPPLSYFEIARYRSERTQSALNTEIKHSSLYCVAKSNYCRLRTALFRLSELVAM